MEVATFDARYQEFFVDLCRICGALGGGSEAEDFAQEALIEGRASLRGLRDDDRVLPWLRRIAVRRMSRLQRRSVLAIGETPDVSPWGLVELAADERTALDALPRHQRQMVALVYFLGYRQEEAAEVLEKSRGHVARTLWEARTRLAKTLADYGSDELG